MGRSGLMVSVRHATAPGVLYPADAKDLARSVDRLLATAAPLHPLLADGAPKALIVPHDAHLRSGPAAAAGFARLRPWRHSMRRIVVVGPGGPTTTSGLTLTDVGAFETPLGTITVDQETCAQLRAFPGVEVDSEVHALESTVEVQLPFLQRLLVDTWTLVPVLVGPGDPSALATALEPLWRKPGTLVVVSSDLSRGHDERTASFLDQRTSAAIVARWWEAVGEHEVSSSTAVRGLLELARRHGCQVEQVALSTSADTGGSPAEVTGYGSFVVR